MKFSEWLKNKNVLIEGKKGKGKKSQVVVEPKAALDLKKGIKIDLKKINPWDVRKGHSSHLSGSGSHDNRPKRTRTRKASNDKAIGEY